MNPTPREQRAADGHDVTPNEARQGVELHRVRHVLWLSLTAAVIAMVVCVLVFVL